MNSARWRQAARSAAVFFALSVLIIYLTPVVHWWARWLSDPAAWQPVQGEVLVVLGGGGLEDGTLGINSYWRTVYAARAWRTAHFRRILLSGGPPERPVAASMRDLLLGLGIPASVIELDTQAGTTRENATRIKGMLSGEREPVLLITSDYHMYRARRVFQRQGIAVRCHAIPDALKRNSFWQERGAIFYELAIETAKILYYRYQRWIG